jgi:hypothetical protein
MLQYSANVAINKTTKGNYAAIAPKKFITEALFVLVLVVNFVNIFFKFGQARSRVKREATR